MKVADMHCDTLYELDLQEQEFHHPSLKENHLNIDLNKMEKGDYLIQNFAVFTHLKENSDVLTHVQHCIDLFYRLMEENKEQIIPVSNYQDIVRCQSLGKMGALLTLEEGAVVHNDLAYLRNYYRLGVRMITLTWNFENGIGYPNFDVNDENHGYDTCDTVHGLTSFGIHYIQEMEKLGIIIDVSHLSDAGFYDVLKYTTKPFVASHSNARSICPHARNMTDDMIKKLSERGGVMGLNYAADFLSRDANMSTIDDMVKHIQHIVSIGGIECVGLGSDFDGIPQNLEMKDASYLPMLENALIQAGFTNEDIERIFYKNVLRVYKEVLK